MSEKDNISGIVRLYHRHDGVKKADQLLLNFAYDRNNSIPSDTFTDIELEKINGEEVIYGKDGDRDHSQKIANDIKNFADQFNKIFDNSDKSKSSEIKINPRIDDFMVDAYITDKKAMDVFINKMYEILGKEVPICLERENGEIISNINKTDLKKEVNEFTKEEGIPLGVQSNQIS